MKISKERLLQIIKEELSEKLVATGSVTGSDMAKNLRQQATQVSQQKGVDPKERGIIQQIQTKLTKLAELGDIKTGSVFTVLQKVNKLMEEEIQKLSQGSANEE